MKPHSFEVCESKGLPLTKSLNVDQIKKLWMLNLIVKTGSLRKAALQAKVSPSAVSQSLASLEKTVGHRLIIRQRGTVQATAEALSVLKEVRPAFEIFEKLQTVSTTTVPQLSWLQFGAYESIAVNVLPGLVTSLQLKLPNLKLGIRTARTGQLLTMVRKGELCCALITEVDDLGRLLTIEVGKDRLGFYISRTHANARRGWELVESTGYGSISPSKDGFPRYMTRYLKQFNGLRQSIASDSFETLRSIAASGTMVCVLPERVATRQDDLLELLPPTSKTVKADTGWHKLLLISPSNCDQDEAVFLADEVRALL